MLPVRVGTEVDFPEVFRMVELLHASGQISVADEPWQQNASSFLIESIAAGTARVVVADHPEGDGLVAIGAATCVHGLPSYWLPNGKLGFLQWFYTEESFRGQGLASTIFDDLIGWLRSNKVLWAHLYTSKSASEFYARRGFEVGYNQDLWKRVS